MRFSGVVSARDHQDLIGFLAGPGELEKRAWAGGLLLVGCGSFIAFSAFTYLWFLIGLFRRGEPHAVLAQPHLVGLVLLGLFMVLLTVVWLRTLGRLWPRFRSRPRDAGKGQDVFREGVNIGEMSFEADEDGLVIASSLARSTYAWSAFQQLVESESNLFLVVDAGAAVILPKAAFGGDAGLEAFKALAGPRIGGAG